MKWYLVELEAGERDELAAITCKGSHRSQKVVNALVLLNCDGGEFNEQRMTGRVVERSTFARRTVNSKRGWSRSVAAIRPRGVRSGRCASWRIAPWSSAISTASRTRRCGGC